MNLNKLSREERNHGEQNDPLSSSLPSGAKIQATEPELPGQSNIEGSPQQSRAQSSSSNETYVLKNL
jgi:hypothetical protein